MKPADLRSHCQVLEICYEVSERRVRQVLQFHRFSYRYHSVADEQAELRIRNRDMAYSRVSYGTGVFTSCWESHLTGDAKENTILGEKIFGVGRRITNF